MLIPLRLEVETRVTPWVNYGLIFANLAVFFAGRLSGRHEAWLSGYGLDGLRPAWWQFFSCLFLHADLMHVGFNMLFLWVFGNSVNSKMGHGVYLLFYLGCGLMASVAELSQGPVLLIGASGAVCGVTSAVVVLFPRATVSMFYFFFVLFGMLQFPVFVLFLLKVFIDLMGLGSSGGGNIAHMAHLGGYASGFLVTLMMLAAHGLARDQFDLFAILRRRRQLAEYRRHVQRGAGPYGRVARREGDAGRVPVARPAGGVRGVQGAGATASGEKAWADSRGSADSEGPAVLDPRAARLSQLRYRVQNALTEHRVDDAIGAWGELLELDPDHILPRAAQLEVANCLLHRGQHEAAMRAYAKHIQRYPKGEGSEHAELFAGLILGRYLGRAGEAEGYLRGALPRLDRSADRQLAESLLLELGVDPREVSDGGGHGR